MDTAKKKNPDIQTEFLCKSPAPSPVLDFRA